MADYNISRKVGKAATLPTAPAFSFGNKFDYTPSEPGPGPGQYAPEVTPQFKGGFFGSSTRHKKASDQTPSPLDYQPDLSPVRRSSQSYTFGVKLVPEHLKNKVPGPGRYDPDASPTKPASPSVGMHTRCHSDREAERKPGPNAYKPDYEPKSPKAASIKFRHEVPAAVGMAPGPGQYDVDARKQNTDGKTFGVSRSYQHLENGVPGPGSYSPDDKLVHTSQAAWSMSHSPRDVPVDLEAPGPGQYSQPPVIPHPKGHSVSSEHKSQPAFTITARYLFSRSAATPGPGDYGVPQDPGRRSAPLFTFKGVTPKDAKAKLPGPGAYNPDRADSCVRHGSPSHSIAHRIEDPGSKDRKPGPGSYDADKAEKKKGAGVSIKFRHEIKPDNQGTPAPHDYADKDFSMYRPTTGPGPRKGFSFGKRLQAKGGEDVPGPEYAVGCSTLGVAAVQQVLNSKVSDTLVL